MLVIELSWTAKNMVFDLNTTFSRSVWLKQDSDRGLDNKQHVPAQRWELDLGFQTQGENLKTDDASA